MSDFSRKKGSILQWCGIVRYSVRVLDYSLRYSPSTWVANYSDSTALVHVFGGRSFHLWQVHGRVRSLLVIGIGLNESVGTVPHSHSLLDTAHPLYY